MATATRRSRSFWEQLSAEADRVGSVAAVAKRHGVNPRTLTWWRWRLRARGGGPELLPVVIAGEASAAFVEIAISGDVRLRIEAGADVKYVAALIAALRAGC